MSDEAENIAQALAEFGLTRDTDGEHFEAWKTAWGAEITLEEEPVWKQWQDALGPQKRNASFIDLAASVGILDSDELEHVALPPCSYIRTPWKTRLSASDGRIMVSSDYRRLEDRVFHLRGISGYTDVVIAGQSGTGRTYLAHYILLQSLARSQNAILFADKRVVLFTSSGVFSGERLEIDFGGYPIFRDVVGSRPLAVVDVDIGNDGVRPLDRMFFSVHVYPPGSHRYREWIKKNGPELLVLDAFSARLTVAAAMVQRQAKSTRSCFQQLLVSLQLSGLNLRSCFTFDSLSLRNSLRDYIATLGPEKLARLAVNARFSPDPLDIVRTGDGPDIFSIRRDIADYEGCLPTIASRFVVSEICRAHGFSGLSELKAMDVIQRNPDGYAETRTWLCEYLSHAILLEASPDHLPALSLSQCFPLNSSKRKGALKMAHLYTRRSLESFDLRSPPSFDPAVYHVVETLPDHTIHAIVHAQPRRTSSARFFSFSDGASGGQKHKLRARKPSAQVLGHQSVTHRRVPADRRFTLFLQIVSGSSPSITPIGLECLQEMMQTDSEAEYFFVFVTGKDVLLDLSAIPTSLLNRLKWYQLSVDYEGVGIFVT